MDRERYLWIFVFIAAILAGSYYHYFYQPQISLLVKFGSLPSENVYPFQKIYLPIIINNTGGSAINNMSLEVLLNQNLSTLYKVSIPAGKVDIVNYNITLNNATVYNVSVIADPQAFAAISNRNKARDSITINVKPPQNAAPYMYLPQKGAYHQRFLDADKNGVAASSYISGYYNISNYALISPKRLYNFLSPLLNLTSPYLRGLSATYAQYRNGTLIYSVWINGYINSSIMTVAAQGAGYRQKTVSLQNKNVSVIYFDNLSTLCSWYENGWIKNIYYETFNSLYTCTALLPNNFSKVNSSSSVQLRKRLLLPGSTLIANYTDVLDTGVSVSSIFIQSNSFIAPYISTFNLGGQICYGIITNSNGSYCNTYILPSNNKVGPIALVKTTQTTDKYNLSILSIVNTTNVFSEIPINIGIIKGFNLSSNSLTFSSGIKNTCSLNASIICTNVSFSNSILHISLSNNLTNDIKLNGMTCFSKFKGSSTKLNTTIKRNFTSNLAINCYNNNNPILGLPLNLKLNLTMNYTIGNSTKIAAGNAYIAGLGG